MGRPATTLLSPVKRTEAVSRWESTDDRREMLTGLIRCRLRQTGPGIRTTRTGCPESLYSRQLCTQASLQLHRHQPPDDNNTARPAPGARQDASTAVSDACAFAPEQQYGTVEKGGKSDTRREDGLFLRFLYTSTDVGLFQGGTQV